MALLHVTLKSGKGVQTFQTRSRQLVIGRGAGANLRVPLPWLADRQLELRHQSGVLRIRALHNYAKVLAQGEVVGDEWVVLPGECEIRVERGSNSLVLALRAEESHGVVILVDDSAEDDHAAYAGALIAGPDGHATSEQPLEMPPPIELQAPTVKSRRGLKLAVVAVMLLVVLVAMLLLGYDSFRAGRARAAETEAYARFQQLVESTLSQIGGSNYTEARVQLKEAETIAQRYKWPEQIEQVQHMMQRPEIQYGANGYVKVRGKWVQPPVAAAWKDAELKYDRQISELIERAASELRDLRFTDSRASCAEAMVLMNHFPEAARPHPRFPEVSKIDSDAHNRLIADEMIASGMVLHAGRWVTPQEQFDLQQKERGLVKYKDQWLSKYEAFAAEQTDKGLVLHEGKWLTQEDKMLAEGYVLFEGAWITLPQRQEIFNAREEQRKAAFVEQEQQRLAALQLAEQRRQEQARAEGLKEDAYKMSQEFLKDTLKNPLSARFERYSHPNVTVVYVDGWFLVKAPVRAQNGFGQLISRYYISKLRPREGVLWQSELTTILDE